MFQNKRNQRLYFACAVVVSFKPVGTPTYVVVVILAFLDLLKEFFAFFWQFQETFEQRSPALINKALGNSL